MKEYTNVLDFCENLPQRQDSLNDQLNDLMRVGNKMGLHDAVTFIKQNVLTEKCEIKYGCYCDLFDDEEPDDCVIDTPNVSHCTFAASGKYTKPEQCPYWKPLIKVPKQKEK